MVNTFTVYKKCEANHKAEKLKITPTYYKIRKSCKMSHNDIEIDGENI